MPLCKHPVQQMLPRTWFACVPLFQPERFIILTLTDVSLSLITLCHWKRGFNWACIYNLQGQMSCFLNISHSDSGISWISHCSFWSPLCSVPYLCWTTLYVSTSHQFSMLSLPLDSELASKLKLQVSIEKHVNKLPQVTPSNLGGKSWPKLLEKLTLWTIILLYLTT